MLKLTHPQPDYTNSYDNLGTKLETNESQYIQSAYNLNRLLAALIIPGVKAILPGYIMA